MSSPSQASDYPPKPQAPDESRPPAEEIRVGNLHQMFTREEGFITEAEEDVYRAAGFVKKEAEAIAEVAEGVEKASRVVEYDVDKVETFVHQVKANAKFMEEEVNEATVTLQHSSQHAVFSSSGGDIEAKQSVSKDFLDLGWGWNVFRLLLLVLTFLVVHIHNSGGMDINLENDSNGGRAAGASTKVSAFTFFNVLLINLGPIVRLLNTLKDMLTREEKILTEVEENVDKAAEEVKRTAEIIGGVAQAVEKVSRVVERDSDQVQEFIGNMKVTTITTHQDPN